MNRSARSEILTRLLEAHERSSAYQKPGPWRRDTILRLDRKTFPAAFAPDGRELREVLTGAALELEREGAVRIARELRGPAAGTPNEIRLGPAEVTRAYQLATREGFEPLALVLEELGRVVRQLLRAQGAAGSPEWYTAWLTGLERGLAAADPSALGMSRERLKQERHEIPDALAAAAVLVRGEVAVWERVLSERLFGDSKRLSKIRTHVVNVLVRADPRWEGVPPEEAFELLEAYGVRRKPGLIRCAGRAEIPVNGRTYKLEDFTPVAHLPDDWGEAWARAVIAAGARSVTTIENEYPFLSYVEECGGAGSLGERGEVVVYIAGFPTPALVRALAGLSASALTFHHWGDADLGGLRIWWFLRNRLGQPLHLVRTTAEFVERAAAAGARPLSGSEVVALRKLRDDLLLATGDDLPAAIALVDALLATGVKVEQERW